MSTRNSNGPWWLGYKRKIKPTLLTLPRELRDMIWAHVTRSSHPAGAQLVLHQAAGYRKLLKAATHAWRNYEASQNLLQSRYDFRCKNQRVAALIRKYDEGVNSDTFNKDMMPGDMSYVMGPLLVNQQMHDEILASIVRENRITLNFNRGGPRQLKFDAEYIYAVNKTQRYILQHGRNLRLLFRSPLEARGLAKELALRPKQDISSLEICYVAWSQIELDTLKKLGWLPRNHWKGTRLSLLTLKNIPAEKVTFTCQEVPDEVRDLYRGRILRRDWVVGAIYAPLPPKLEERAAPVAKAMMQLARDRASSPLQPAIPNENGKRAREEYEDYGIEGSPAQKRPRDNHAGEADVSAVSGPSGLFGNPTHQKDAPNSIADVHSTVDGLTAPDPSASSTTISDTSQRLGCDSTPSSENVGDEDMHNNSSHIPSVLEKGRKRGRDQDVDTATPQSKRPRPDISVQGQKRMREVEDDIMSSPAKRHRSGLSEMASEHDGGNNQTPTQAEHVDSNPVPHGKKRARDDDLGETATDSRSAKKLRLQEEELEMGAEQPQAETVDDTFASLFEEPDPGPQDDPFASLFEDPDELVPPPQLENQPGSTPGPSEAIPLITPSEPLPSSSHACEPEPSSEPAQDHAPPLPPQHILPPPPVRRLSNGPQLVADDPWFRGLTRNT